MLLLASLSSVRLLASVASVSTVASVFVAIAIAAVASVTAVLVSVSVSIAGWLGVFGFTFVLDVGDVAVLVGAVGDDLSAAVGEEDAVRSGDDFAVALGFVGVVVLGGLVFNGVGEFVRHRLLLYGDETNQRNRDVFDCNGF